jgi:transposase
MKALHVVPGLGSGGAERMAANLMRLLEEDIEERPAATVSERRRFLEHITGRTLSDSTIRWLLKRMGFSRKNDREGAGTIRVLEGGLEGEGRPRTRRPAVGIRRR